MRKYAEEENGFADVQQAHFACQTKLGNLHQPHPERLCIPLVKRALLAKMRFGGFENAFSFCIVWFRVSGSTEPIWDLGFRI